MKAKTLVLAAILGGFVMANAAGINGENGATSGSNSNLAQDLAHKSAPAQQLVKAGSLGGFSGSEASFTGQVAVKRLFGAAEYRAFGGALVEFSAGARTAWHTHPAGQTLIVTDGVILTATERGDATLAFKGDVVLCPPDVRHFHGATAQQSGAHIALTGVKDGQNVVWLEHVTDQEYRAALKKASEF